MQTQHRIVASWWRAAVMRMVAASVLAPLLSIVGCASMQTGAGKQYAQQARDAAEAVRECAGAHGVTPESVQATVDAGEPLTNAEQALAKALEAEADANMLESQLDSVQNTLDNLLDDQTQVTSQLDPLYEQRENIRGKIRFFNKRLTELGSISQALEEVTGDSNEYPGVVGEIDDMSTQERQFLEGGVVTPIATAAGFVGGPVALGVFIGDVMGTEVAEARLRDLQQRTVQDLVGVLQELEDLARQAGFDDYADDLVAGISAGQTYMGQVSNPDRDLDPEQMVEGMLNARETLFRLEDAMSARVTELEEGLDAIAASTAGELQKQEQIVEDLAHARNRAQAALRACHGYDAANPFTNAGQPYPDWSSTFWDISSP